MKENIYDSEEFFEKYSQTIRSRIGLKGAGEWPTLKEMLPEFKDKRVLDLGCGYGWHCMYAEQQGAKYVLGIDQSEKMINEARRRNSSDNIEYHIADIEKYEYPPASFDIVISSLALHYIKDLTPVFGKISRTLVRKGIFVFTIEHPIFTAQGTQEWITDKENNKICWPVDNYFIEGKREADFLGEKVIKYHHTLTSILQGLINIGFTITEIAEPQPTQEMLEHIPEMKDELRRPVMLAISATRN